MPIKSLGAESGREESWPITDEEMSMTYVDSILTSLCRVASYRERSSPSSSSSPCMYCCSLSRGGKTDYVAVCARSDERLLPVRVFFYNLKNLATNLVDSLDLVQLGFLPSSGSPGGPDPTLSTPSTPAFSSRKMSMLRPASYRLPENKIP